MDAEIEVKPVRESTVSARVPSTLADRITREAKQEDRTISYIVGRILSAHYEREDEALEQAA